MNLILLLVIILVILTVAGLPQWGIGGAPYGYYPSGLLSLLLIVLIIALLLGYRF